ncbi:MAG: SPFH domain-containing protein [Candidatus Aenigmarchaeota archaeon]|nr:SPFH domain-containing protein [Candidatus Aenigmarchaeota archaeon]
MVYERGNSLASSILVGGIGFIALLILLWVFAPGIFNIFVRSLPYIILIILVFFGFYKVFIIRYGETERGIIYRVGKFNRVAGPGWHIVIPFFEREFSRVDVRTKTVNLVDINAVTRDDIPLTLNIAFFYAIVDPRKAVLQVTVLEDALNNFVFGVIRDAAGTFVMRETFYNIEGMNEEFKKRLVFALEEWGAEVKNVEILNVKVPDEVFNALITPVTSEQKAIAARFDAEARRVAVEVLGDAAERLNPNALTYLYLKALERIASAPGSRVVLPASFPRVTDSLMTGIGVGAGLETIDSEKVIAKIAKKIKGE